MTENNKNIVDNSKLLTTENPIAKIMMIAIEESLVISLSALDKNLPEGCEVDKHALVLSVLTRALYDKMVLSLDENPKQTRTMLHMMMTDLVMAAAEESCEKKMEG